MESPTSRPPNPFAEWMSQRFPWSPSLIIVGGALTGLLGAGLLAALNWELLGQPQKRRQALRWIAIPGLIVYGAMVVAFSRVSLDSLIGLHALLGLGGSLGIYRWQERAYWTWRDTVRYDDADFGRNNSQLFSLIIGFLIATLLIVGGVNRLLASSERLTFSQGPLSLTYSSSWEQVPFPQEYFCGSLGTECYLRVEDQTHAAVIQTSSLPFWGSDDLLEALMHNLLENAAETTVIQEGHWREVDGRRAYEAFATFEGSVGDVETQSLARSVVVLYDRRAYIIEVLALSDLALRLNETEFNAVLDSVTFSAGDE